MKVIKILSYFVLCASLTNLAQGQQKSGFVSTEAIIALLPVTQRANDELRVMQTKFLAQEQGMQQDMKTKYDELVAKNTAGELTPNLEQLGRQELAQIEQDIVDHRKQTQETLSKRQSVLFKPIVKQVTESISKVAEAQGFDMVFDRQESGIRYGNPDFNLTKAVLLELGVPQADIDEAFGDAG